ncbi:MAG: hypothetical protein NT076_05880, partial [Candidatus Pacearchaeota archaeon]|nr:hypothetical protein [Candidatus Pacearchaeota archaeon]
MLRKIIFLICIICSFFLALTLVSAVNISDCQELNITNTVYSLTQNVDSSTGSAENCFNITANNVTLDCNGFEINYSSIVKVGNGISIIGQNFTTIKNCIMKYSQAGNIIFLVMANNGLIQNNTIEVGANSEAIRIWGSNYNVVTQNSISSIGTGSTAIILTTSSDHNNITFNNIIGGSLMNYGIYLYYSNFSYVASNIIDMGRGYSYGLGVRGAGDYNTIFNNTITTSGNNGYGLYVDIFTSSNIFTSNRITTYGQSADGIFIETRTKNNSFSLMDVRTNNTGYPLVVGQLSNNFTFSDSLLDASLSGITSVNISKTNDCFANFTNVTHLDLTPFDLSWSSVANFTLNAMWYLDLNVFNTTSQLEGANVSLYDRNHNLIFSELTNSSGMIPRKTLLEYTKNLTASVYYTNFNLTVTKTGFNDSVLSINLTSNQFRNVVLYKPGETIYPTLTIFSPINTTYYINQSIAVEFSADPSYQEMWYTVDCGATNHTYLGFTSVNFTINSSKSIVFYANSTMGNVSSSAINFSIANLPANTTIASTQSSLEINNTIEMVVLAYKSAMKVI